MKKFNCKIPFVKLQRKAWRYPRVNQHPLIDENKQYIGKTKSNKKKLKKPNQDKIKTKTTTNKQTNKKNKPMVNNTLHRKLKI